MNKHHKMLLQILSAFCLLDCASVPSIERSSIVGTCVKPHISVTRTISSVPISSDALAVPVERPRVSQCQIESVRASLASVERNINRMLKGSSPSGSIVIGAIARENSCDPQTKFCTPLPQPLSEFKYFISDSVTDSCLKYCTIVHEWEHFIDRRPWRLDSTDDELAIAWEMRPYQKQRQCLQQFLGIATDDGGT